MNEKFEYQGYWWLPGADEDKVPGILKFDPGNRATLDLLGSLKGLKGVIDPREPEILLGLSSDGKLVTLKDCGRTGVPPLERFFRESDEPSSTSYLVAEELFSPPQRTVRVASANRT